MLDSFRRQHPEFTGDIVILYDDASDAPRTTLESYFENLLFAAVSDGLKRRVETLCEHFPPLQSIKARFYALEAFTLQNYDRVIFADSDLLFVQPIHEFLSAPEPLVACQDETGYYDKWRDLSTFWDVPSGSPNACICFNSGLFSIGAALLNDDIYHQLLDALAPELVPEYMALADQYILNRCFTNQARLLDTRYNYLVLAHQAIYKCEGFRLKDAKVLHFAGGVKPWKANSLMDIAAKSDLVQIRAHQQWNEAYFAFLNAQAKRIVFRGVTPR